MTNNFIKAFSALISNEGGYKKEAKDRMDWTSGQIGIGVLAGTKFGISAGTYPKLNIAGLTLEDAQRIYKEDWWDRFKGDQLPHRLAFQIFDAEVNHGAKMGVKFLQRALGVTDDGVLGPVTLASVSKMDEDKIIMRFLAVRLRYFTEIKTWDTYGRGWARRVVDNLLLASETKD